MIFYFVHFLRISWFPALPGVLSLIFSFKLKLYNIKNIFYVMIYSLIGLVFFMLNSDFSNGLSPALIDLKQFFIFLMYPSFYYFNKTHNVDITVLAKLIVLLSLISSFMIGFGLFPPNTIIRTDATYLIASSFILLLPKNAKEVKENFIYYLFIIYLLLAYLGRTTILALVISLMYYILIARKTNIVSRQIKYIYYMMFSLFTILGLFIFAVRASDIFTTTGTSFVENESRFLAIYLFVFQVIPNLSLIEFISGAGFGVDYSQYMNTANLIINLHIDNIVTGNNNMYPALGFHNEFIRIFLLTGILGFSFAMLFLSSFYKKINYYNSKILIGQLRLNTFLILVFISMFGHGFFGSTITSTWTLFIFANLKSDLTKNLIRASK